MAFCRPVLRWRFFSFFFNDAATTEIYTLSLHDALPIGVTGAMNRYPFRGTVWTKRGLSRSEEHTSELQSQFHLVCRLLLEKKNTAPVQRQPASAPLAACHPRRNYCTRQPVYWSEVRHAG